VLVDDAILADVDLLHDEAEDLLTLLDRQRLRPLVERREERLEGLGQSQVGLFVMDLRDERLEVGSGCVRLLPQLGDPVAQFLERDQLLLVGLDESAARFLVASQLALKPVFLLHGRAGTLLSLREASLQLLVDQLRIAEQLNDGFPDLLIEAILYRKVERLLLNAGRA
jgi:hypothetical protein